MKAHDRLSQSGNANRWIWAQRTLGAATAALTIGGCYDPQIKYELEDRIRIENMRVSTLSFDNQLTVALRAGDLEPKLVLRRNDKLLAPDARVIRDGKALTLEEAGVRLPFEGAVEGDPDSWVRVRVAGGVVEGMLFTDGQLWELRRSEEDDQLWMNKADIGDFIDNPTHEQRTCASTSAQALVVGDEAAAAPAAQAAQGCTQLEMALVADHTYVEELGGVQAAENEMLNRINESDGIFRSDLNYGFKITALQTFSSPTGPAFNTSNEDLPLDPFREFKQQNFPNEGLAHLFVARTTSGAVGVAFVGATCSSFGVGVSNHLGPGRSSTIVVAHEIGHNFGSDHDANNSPFVMRPSVNAAATEFSDSSQTQIDDHVASRSCFVPCETASPVPPKDEEEPTVPEDPETPSEPENDTDGSEGGESGDSGETPPVESCEDSCGAQSPSGCWCDDQCQQFGDCCEDFGAVCQSAPDEPEPAEESCQGFCGGESEDGCWCDSQCQQFGDCCADFVNVCL